MFMQEAILGVYINPISYFLLLGAAIAGFVGASTHHRAVKGSGFDTDDAPSGWIGIACCLFIVAGLIAAPASSVRHESQLLSDQAFSKYNVSYVSQGAHSQLSHFVTLMPTAKVQISGHVIEVAQRINQDTGELSLTTLNSGRELPLR